MTEPATITLLNHVLNFSYCYESGIDLYLSHAPNLAVHPPRTNETEWKACFYPTGGKPIRATGESLKETETNLADQILAYQENVYVQLHELSTLNLSGQ